MYIINQSFAGDECVFEFALCMDCREKMHNQLSEPSKVAMFDFMHDHIDMEQREEQLGTDSATEDYITSCITCHQPRSATNGYTLGAMFAGHELIKGPFPMLMCSTCEEALADSLSDETRKVWDRFIAENFPGPPSEVKLPTGSKPVLI
ncbi:hypothetical protein HW115_03360 [Verrucomicrobiaceae bacterium N1E253]|uniref:Uncharacterized protein n=2 Tax=Oceaniferula marina TaxID=2748318 RepID=A0A851GAI6_9BACT|nr:hypothetical protein [Oceaniferula marina]